MGLMYAPHTVTLVNAYDNDGAMEYQATVLSGVFLDVKHSALAAALGAKDADSVTLFIPFDVAATGTDGTARTYASPKAFQAAEDKSGLWTLEASGETSLATCFFFRGEAEAMSYKAARQTMDDVYRVSGVLTRDFGDDAMRHWEVKGA